jgi:hypothetical protein
MKSTGSEIVIKMQVRDAIFIRSQAIRINITYIHTDIKDWTLFRNIFIAHLISVQHKKANIQKILVHLSQVKIF